MGSVSLFVASKSCFRCSFSLAAVKECHGDQTIPSVGITLKAIGYLARVDSASPSSVLFKGSVASVIHSLFSWVLFHFICNVFIQDVETCLEKA